MKVEMRSDGRLSIHEITYHYVFNECRTEIFSNEIQWSYS